MSPDNQIRAFYLHRQILAVSEFIAEHEVRALLPPASCSEIELFTEMELQEAAKLKAYRSILQADLRVLEGQGELALSA